MLRLIKLNSEIFQRIVMESIFEKNEIARVSVSKEICNYKKKHPYDIYYSDDKKFLLELEKIKEINSDFKNVSFFILPYINGYNMTHKIEEQFRNNNIQHINLSKVLKKDFYLDCDNFWDVSHFNHNSASKIAQIIWPN